MVHKDYASRCHVPYDPGSGLKSKRIFLEDNSEIELNQLNEMINFVEGKIFGIL
jgi:hypothetical protein